jgi:hypothetical protein
MSMSMCVSVCLCLCLCMSVCASVCVCVCLSVCLSVYVSESVNVFFCLSVSVSICDFVCLCLSVSFCVCLCLSVPVCACLCLSVCLSACLFVSFIFSLCLHEYNRFLFLVLLDHLATKIDMVVANLGILTGRVDAWIEKVNLFEIFSCLPNFLQSKPNSGTISPNLQPIIREAKYFQFVKHLAQQHIPTHRPEKVAEKLASCFHTARLQYRFLRKDILQLQSPRHYLAFTTELAGLFNENALADILWCYFRTPPAFINKATPLSSVFSNSVEFLDSDPTSEEYDPADFFTQDRQFSPVLDVGEASD